MSEPIKNRYEFSLLFDVENGNPNGDPDAGNLPRVDPVSQHGLVTDVCLKRKIRNYVDTLKEGEPGYQIYVSKGESLNSKDEKAFIDAGVELDAGRKMTKKTPEIDKKIRDFMCRNFYDIRTFGAVMTTMVKNSLNCGQVTGPVQLNFAKSIDPIIPQEISITRVAITKDEDLKDKSTEMGRKSMVLYGLYRVDGYVSANLARKVTGFSEEDLELLWKALENMFEIDHSAARGKMNTRKLVVFKHDNELGNCPAHKLFESLEVTKKEGVDTPTSFNDYEITLHTHMIPEGVEVQERV